MTISSSSPSKCDSALKSGFTLVELMVVMALSSMVVALVMPTYVFFFKGMLSVANYAEMSADSRTALEVFSRDLHVATRIDAADTTSLTLTLPSELNSAEVEYTYDASLEQLTRSTTISGSTVTRQLFGDVELFEFKYYNRLGVNVTASASILSETKSVQINAKLMKDVAQIANSDYIISARFLMRNI